MNYLENLKLIGIIIIVLGFCFKLDVIAVVVFAAIATGLVSGMSFVQILEVMGKSFTDTRLMSIFLLSFPVIVILERYGLKERSSELILKLKNTTAGKLLYLYAVIRTIAAALSIRLGGHAQFVRPLILPMAQASANTDDENKNEKIKAFSAAVENYANFFGQNIFVGASGGLLIQQTLVSLGYDVSLVKIAIYSIPMGIIMLIFVYIQSVIFDKKIGKVK